MTTRTHYALRVSKTDSSGYHVDEHGLFDGEIVESGGRFFLRTSEVSMTLRASEVVMLTVGDALIESFLERVIRVQVDRKLGLLICMAQGCQFTWRTPEIARRYNVGGGPTCTHNGCTIDHSRLNLFQAYVERDRMGLS